MSYFLRTKEIKLIKAVIFDMDGTIIDSEPLHFILEEKLFNSLGIYMDKEEHDKFIGTTSYYMWEILKNKYKLKEKIEDLVQKDRDEYYLTIFNNPDKIIEMEGAVSLIKELYKKDLKLCLASSSPINVINIVLKNLKVEKMFSQVVTGDAVENSKPSPDIFLKSAELLEVLPEECIVFEDSNNGVLAAKRAGMKCVGIDNCHSGSQDISSADVIIKSFKNLNLKKIF
ncbi:MAG: HAD family phosphatase [Clostridiaceae bacterium]